MKITFLGAAHEVTGSCYLIETQKTRVLVDCGMFQGSNFNEGKNHDAFTFEPATLDAILVTHPHLDHVGRIPKVLKEGFHGHIYMTKGACELAKMIWDDAYSIMTYNHKKFQEPILFDTTDIAAAESASRGVDYHETVTIGDIQATWYDAGHIFGSAFIVLEAEGKRVVVSGDIGNENLPIVKDTEALVANIDVLLCESTYGDRLHEPMDVGETAMLNLIKEGVARGGTIMMPSFSLERTQEILYRLHDAIEHDKTLQRMPIFLDSPLAINALSVYKKYSEYYDADAAKEYRLGEDFLSFRGLVLTPTVEESKKINSVPGPKMIIAGSGMMNGGRIVHHAFRYVSDPKSTLIIVGYQAQGTLGRRLYEGASKVRIFNEDIEVHCAIKAIGAFSAHADQKKLLSWVGSGGAAPKKVFCVHGEAHAATELAHRIRDQYHNETFVPEIGETVDV